MQAHLIFYVSDQKATSHFTPEGLAPQLTSRHDGVPIGRGRFGIMPREPAILARSCLIPAGPLARQEPSCISWSISPTSLMSGRWPMGQSN